MFILSVVATTCLAASFGVWMWIISRWSRREALLVMRPRSPVPWRGVHVAIAFLIYVLIPGLGAAAVGRGIVSATGVSDDTNNDATIVATLIAVSLLVPLAAGLIVAILRGLRSATAEDLGWPKASIRKDLTIGLVTFLAAAPVVYGLQAALNALVQSIWGKPILHPIIQKILDNPTPAILFWSCVAAVLVAPIVEEFLFRVVLQGWLESLVMPRPPLAEALESERDADEHPLVQASVVDAETVTQVEAGAGNPYVSPSIGQSDPKYCEAPTTIPWPRMAIPVVLSSMTFALFHLGHGPAPIPLFFLAIALGYVYLKTHRMLPCVLIHMALNASSMAVLWASLG